MSPTMASLGLDKLTAVQRRALVDELLDANFIERTAGPLTPAQADELDRRIAEDDANPDDVIPWEQVKSEARARHHR